MTSTETQTPEVWGPGEITRNLGVSRATSERDGSMGEHYGRTVTGEMIGPYDTGEELERELADSNREAETETVEWAVVDDRRPCGNCGGELLEVAIDDGFQQDVFQCQACLTIWVECESGAREPILYSALQGPELWGPGDVTEHLGVSRATMKRWRDAGGFPEPYQELSIGPVWLAEDVRKWSEDRKRDAA